jgi:hypothetical protein
MASAKLGVLTAPAVEQAIIRLLPVPLTLTTHTQSNAWQGLSASLGDRLVAFLTMRQALALRKIGTSPFEGVFHGAVDLVLNRTVL